MTASPGAGDKLSSELVAYYRQVLDTHKPKDERRVCSVCKVARCPDWLDAYDKLAAALQARYAGLLDRTALYQPYPGRQDDPRLPALVKAFNGSPS